MLLSSGCRISAIEEARPGDTVWFTPHTSMTHISVAEEENGTAVDWQENVIDAPYAGC